MVTSATVTSSVDKLVFCGLGGVVVGPTVNYSLEVHVSTVLVL